MAIEYLFDHINEIFPIIRQSDKCLLFLDYDGTLVGIKSRPQDAKPSQRTKRIVFALNSNPRIFPVIVSGRQISQIMDFFKGNPIKELNIVGSHGAEFKLKGSSPKIAGSARKQMGIIKELGKKIKACLKDAQCFYIEQKIVSVAVHYRNCSKKDMPRLDDVRTLIGEVISEGGLDVIEGKKIIEVKSSGINKGKAIAYMQKKLRQNGNQISLCVGDDITDEYMFSENTRGINIKVSAGPDIQSRAGYYLNNVGEVLKFLAMLNREVR